MDPKLAQEKQGFKNITSETQDQQREEERQEKEQREQQLDQEQKQPEDENTFCIFGKGGPDCVRCE